MSTARTADEGSSTPLVTAGVWGLCSLRSRPGAAHASKPARDTQHPPQPSCRPPPGEARQAATGPSGARPAAPTLQKSVAKGDYLWELISPKDKDGLPCKSPTGRYRVRLFIMVSSGWV